MTVTTTPGALKKFRRTPWRFQQTVERPDAGDLERFVSTIISAHGSLEAATVTIDAVIFDTVRMSGLCPTGAAITHDVSLVAQSAEEAQALLVAAFGTAQTSSAYRRRSHLFSTRTMTIGLPFTRTASRTSTMSSSHSHHMATCLFRIGRESYNQSTAANRRPAGQ